MGYGSSTGVTCSIGRRHSSDLVLLWCRLGAVAAIRPLAWELPFALAVALKKFLKKLKKIFFSYYFPTVQQGGQVILRCIHCSYSFFPPPFLLLRHEYLDKVLNAIQQDLLVNLF